MEYPKFGEGIKKRRKYLDLSQLQLGMIVFAEEIPAECKPFDPSNKSQLAQLENIRKKIVNYEKGTVPRDPETLHRLCDALDCDMDYLFGRIDVPKLHIAKAMEATGLSKITVQRLIERNTEKTAQSFFDRHPEYTQRDTDSILEFCKEWNMYDRAFTAFLDEFIPSVECNRITSAISSLLGEFSGKKNLSYGHLWKIQDSFISFVKRYTQFDAMQKQDKLSWED